VRCEDSAGFAEAGISMRLEFGTNNRPLRDALDVITRHHVNDDVGRQISEIANLALKYPHTISLVREAVSSRPETFQFNCYQHAFDLVNVESVTRVMKDWGSVYPGRDFVQFLVESRLQEISVEKVNTGDHVVYAAGRQIEHAGRVVDDGIESKWGLMHLWRHGVYEVPWHYGSTVRFFRRLPQEDLIRAFLEYAAIRGVATKADPQLSR